MENTYAYLKTVFQNLRHENSRNPSLIFILLVLWCIPLSYGFNSMAMALLFGYALFTFQKNNFRFNELLVLPVSLFLLMAISTLWSGDFNASLRAVSKGLSLLLLPISFVLMAPLSAEQRQKILRYYSYGIIIFSLYYLIRATIRFLMTQNPNVFFYHELVTEDVNAIHVSVYVAVAAFYFITKPSKSKGEIAAIILLAILLLLLSSKNIIVIFFILLAGYFLFCFKSERKGILLTFGAIFTIALLIVFSGKIKERFLIEFQSNTSENTVNTDIGTATEKVYNVSAERAWTAERFRKNDYFPGTAFRVYQIRIFTEMLNEDKVFFTGYGVNAADAKIAAKAREHNLYEDYGKKNFHNEYIQVFAELGIFGLLILLLMVVANLQIALKTKDFVHISFAVLMISLFLTESFLSRQRGIVFFTIFYCLFNAKNDVPNTVKNKT